MTISTLDDLEALPVGQHVRVNSDRNQIFKRDRNGFTRDGVTMPISAFSGAVKASLVDVFDLSVAVGDWYRRDHTAVRHALVVEPYQSGWRVLIFREGRFYGTDRLVSLGRAGLDEVPRTGHRPEPGADPLRPDGHRRSGQSAVVGSDRRPARVCGAGR